MRRALEAAYATPPRAYHNAGHVNQLLRHFHEVQEGPGWHAPAPVWLALLYHDAVYGPGRSDNEARSAVLAREHIARWLPTTDIDADRVAGLVELTARHGRIEPGELGEDAAAQDARHFLDCDMAVLGAPPDEFAAYDRGIAAEYRGHVPAWLYRLNRKRFLKTLLQQPRLYLSDFFHQRLDAQARINLRRAVTHKQ
ncbi:HD domain-containing protein [Lysobacter sp. A3-1-A15]|uniref:HD domain-containing protein n=1 Tax=Novilysobacter viscosus TaxID=3098602 RepID=UPI002ED875BB